MKLGCHGQEAAQADVQSIHNAWRDVYCHVCRGVSVPESKHGEVNREGEAAEGLYCAERGRGGHARPRGSDCTPRPVGVSAMSMSLLIYLCMHDRMTGYREG